MARIYMVYIKSIRFQKFFNSRIKNVSAILNLNRNSLNYKICSTNLLMNIQQYADLHTSCLLRKRRKTAEERKSARIIEYSPKSKMPIIDIWRDITIAELAKVLNKDVDYVYELFSNTFKYPNTPITDVQVLQHAVHRSGHRIRLIGKPKTKEKAEDLEKKDVHPLPPPKKGQLKPRPPVVTVMGHVDHGKTTLLDALRRSHVVDQEFGGITQHIGAFSVPLESGSRITFLDTPGHAAFSAMRARGANLTDMVVLVVAADDGVMEQTIESIKMARQAGVPIIVAINKIDSPKADIERTEKMLAEIGINIEKFGGDVQAIPISALKKTNIQQLVEALMLQAELLEIGADPSGPVEAVVVESKVHPHRGKLCTVVVQRGTLKKGQILVAGTAMARVRTLRDEEGNQLQQVLPGYPAEIEGWKELPSAGEQVLQVDSEKRAKEVLKVRLDQREQKKLEQDAVVIAQKSEQHEREYKEQLDMKRKLGRFRLKREGPRKPEIPKDDDGPPSLNIVLKADVDGTLEALLDTLDSYHSEECKLDLVHYGVGAVTQTDIELAEIFNGVIYAFNVDVPHNLKELLENTKVEIKHHNIIYKLIDDVKSEINSRLPPKEVEDVLGEATVLQQFEISQGRKKVAVAGCRCIKGILKRTALFKVIRNGEVIYTGPLLSMRHLKNEADVIKSNMECGLQLEDKTITFQEGDTIVCFEKKTVSQETDWDPGF